MLFLVLSIIVTVALFVVLGIVEVKKNDRGYEYTEKAWKLNKVQFLCLFGLLICLFGCFANVPANHVGILYSPFGGTKAQTLSEGFKTKNIFDTVYKISTLNQEMKLEGITTQTKDSQWLNTALSVKYNVNEENAYMVFKQYKTLEKMSEQMVKDTVQRELEEITIKYNVIGCLGEERDDVYNELDVALKEEFSKYGVNFISVTINDMSASDALEKAIDDEAVAKKAVETAEQKLEEAKIKAQELSVQATAEQEAAKIKAETMKIEAQAQKEANELLTISLTDSVLQQKWIEKWNGKLPTYLGGDGDLMIGIEKEE